MREKLNQLKEQWHQFKDAEPGHRFQERYERHQKDAQQNHGKAFNIVLGLIVVIVGLIMIPAPGPGAIIACLGLSLLGSEFEGLARFLDKAELRLRPLVGKARDIWTHTSLSFKGAVSFLALACAVGIAYGAYHFIYLGMRAS